MLSITKRFWMTLTFILLLSLLIAACGGDDDSNDDDNNDNPTAQSNPDDSSSDANDIPEVDPLADSDLLPLDLSETYTFESGAAFQHPRVNWFLFDDDTVQEGVVLAFQGGAERAANGVVLDQEDLAVSVPDAASIEDVIRGYVAQSPLWPSVTLDDVLFTERTTPDGRQMLFTAFADQSNNEVLIVGVDLGNDNRGLMYFTSTGPEHPADIEEALLQIADTFMGG